MGRIGRLWCMFPLNAESGSLVLHRDGQDRAIGKFDVLSTEVSEYFPKKGPIGTLVIIRGKNFGIHSEGGETAYAFDFEAANNGVSIGGVARCHSSMVG